MLYLNSAGQGIFSHYTLTQQLEVNRWKCYFSSVVPLFWETVWQHGLLHWFTSKWLTAVPPKRPAAPHMRVTRGLSERDVATVTHTRSHKPLFFCTILQGRNPSVHRLQRQLQRQRLHLSHRNAEEVKCVQTRRTEFHRKVRACLQLRHVEKHMRVISCHNKINNTGTLSPRPTRWTGLSCFWRFMQAVVDWLIHGWWWKIKKKKIDGSGFRDEHSSTITSLVKNFFMPMIHIFANVCEGALTLNFCFFTSPKPGWNLHRRERHRGETGRPEETPDAHGRGGKTSVSPPSDAQLSLQQRGASITKSKPNEAVFELC